VRVTSSGTFNTFAEDNGGNYPQYANAYTVTVSSQSPLSHGRAIELNDMLRRLRRNSNSIRIRILRIVTAVIFGKRIESALLVTLTV